MNASEKSKSGPWIKQGASYNLNVKLLKLSEQDTILDAETGAVNQELLDSLMPRLLISPTVFNLVFYKDDEKVSLNEIYQCILHKYGNTTDEPDLHENLGLVLDALKNVGSVSKNSASHISEQVPSILFSFLGDIMLEASLLVGAIANVEGHLCFLKLTPCPTLFLPSSKTKLPE